MLAHVAGSRSSFELFKGADASIPIVVTNDDGSALDITGGAVDVLVYDRSDRYNAAIATHSGDTLTAPTAGHATLALTDAEMSYGVGTYYAFVRVTDGGLVTFAEPLILNVR